MTLGARPPDRAAAPPGPSFSRRRRAGAMACWAPDDALLRLCCATSKKRRRSAATFCCAAKAAAARSWWRSPCTRRAGVLGKPFLAVNMASLPAGLAAAELSASAAAPSPASTRRGSSFPPRRRRRFSSTRSAPPRPPSRPCLLRALESGEVLPIGREKDPVGRRPVDRRPLISASRRRWPGGVSWALLWHGLLAWVTSRCRRCARPPATTSPGCSAFSTSRSSWTSSAPPPFRRSRAARNAFPFAGLAARLVDQDWPGNVREAAQPRHASWRWGTTGRRWRKRRWREIRPSPPPPSAHRPAARRQTRPARRASTRPNAGPTRWALKCWWRPCAAISGGSTPPPGSSALRAHLALRADRTVSRDPQGRRPRPRGARARAGRPLLRPRSRRAGRRARGLHRGLQLRLKELGLPPLAPSKSAAVRRRCG